MHSKAAEFALNKVGKAFRLLVQIENQTNYNLLISAFWF